jgi:tRNA (guanine37-N1)-methyltransferase
MRIDILTLFPEQFESALSSSIPKIAQEKSLLEINLVNWRGFATDSHGTVDDRPYGGGSGMVLKVDVLDKALQSLRQSIPGKTPYVILLTPQGKKFTQKVAVGLTKENWLVLICGHYEGFDERIREHLVNLEVSIGDYILSGGEIPAMVLTDTIARLLPGVLGNSNSAQDETFSDNLLEYPQYTRPEDYQGWKVPQVLLSGNHTEIKKWRHQRRLEITKKKRPDLS